MAASKYIIIDGVQYGTDEHPVRITELKRKADILDKYAERSEDGELHREVIGTFHNYSLKLGVRKGDRELYNTLFDVLSAPVASHEVVLPHDGVSFRGYFSSIQDDIHLVDDDGFDAQGLQCNLVAMKPRRYANG